MVGIDSFGAFDAAQLYVYRNNRKVILLIFIDGFLKKQIQVCFVFIKKTQFHEARLGKLFGPNFFKVYIIQREIPSGVLVSEGCLRLIEQQNAFSAKRNDMIVFGVGNCLQFYPHGLIILRIHKHNTLEEQERNDKSLTEHQHKLNQKKGCLFE
ncbi:MAG: hypothetical protein WCQ41_09440 [Bacillota bacterium]